MSLAIPRLFRLLSALAFGSALIGASEQLIKPAFGFDLSFTAALPHDRRFSGSAIGFELSLLAVTDNIRVGVYHERGYWRGEDQDEQVTVNGSFNAMHVDYQILSSARQQVSLFVNAGHIAFRDGLTRSAFASDLGVRYDPLKAVTPRVTTQFGVSLCYRYCHIPSTEVFGAGSRMVDDAGGFLAGVHGLVRF
jgi:hypothetical protein